MCVYVCGGVFINMHSSTGSGPLFIQMESHQGKHFEQVGGHDAEENKDVVFMFCAQP